MEPEARAGGRLLQGRSPGESESPDKSCGAEQWVERPFEVWLGPVLVSSRSKGSGGASWSPASVPVGPFCVGGREYALHPRVLTSWLSSSSRLALPLSPTWSQVPHPLPVTLRWPIWPHDDYPQLTAPTSTFLEPSSPPGSCPPPQTSRICSLSPRSGSGTTSHSYALAKVPGLTLDTSVCHIFHISLIVSTSPSFHRKMSWIFLLLLPPLRSPVRLPSSCSEPSLAQPSPPQRPLPNHPLCSSRHGHPVYPCCPASFHGLLSFLPLVL